MACHIGHISPQQEGDGKVTVELWASHVRVKRPCRVVQSRPSTRGEVCGLSPRASRRLRWAVENTPELCSRQAFFICLTYPAEWPKDGRTVKRHLDALGKRCRRAGGCFAWALEYQTRGAPHFHLLARFPESWDIRTVRVWVASGWYEIVGSGDERHLRAGTSVERVRHAECAGWYISGYLGKECQKTVPDGVALPGRMWGMVGVRTPKPEKVCFGEGVRDGIRLVRLIRRWAASDHAFRQRRRFLSASEIKEIERACPDIRIDSRFPVVADVGPEKRTSWSPRDSGRGKGFSVRNAAPAARQMLARCPA
ncbi:MAG: hypothetical protein LBW77_00545 [Verrucomicrobiota bacterium]|jgi:hypothetical protein|nr:hypothetical protein [Verrucomicrobiota bacterium]